MSETSVGYTTYFGTESERLAFQIPDDTTTRGLIWVTPEGNEYRSIGGRWHDFSQPTKSEAVDFEGKQSMNTVFGEVTTAERSDRFNIQFQYNVSNRDVISENTGTGVVDHAGESRARYGTVTMSTDGTKDVIITVYRNGTLTGASFVDVDTDNSTCEYDTSATAYTPSEDPICGTIMGKVDKVRINLFENDVVIPIRPGETVTLCADSANASEMNVFLRHIEEF